jgi:hypothetical protein
MKNARYLKENEPGTFDKRSAEGFGTGLDVDVLSKLHRLRHDSPELARHESLATFLRHRSLPQPRSTVSDPLFIGTVHFVQVTFETSNGHIAVNDRDMATIVQYAKRAAVPISKYASQYGPDSLSIASTILTYTASTPNAAFGDAMLQKWVDDIAAGNNLRSDSCVAIIVPNGVRAGGVSANAGYHSLATIPYIVMGVHEDGLTIQDEADVYAMVVSHEIAEMVVDPKVDNHNPEVCDPCDLNCGNLTRDYFDSGNAYLGSNQNSPPSGFNFDYYTCAIAKPHGASRCPASHADCEYAPPSLK